MKKNFLLITLIGITTLVNAQWNPNGNNSTTGRITANDILVNNLHVAYGNMSSSWSQHPHLKDKTFIYTNSSSKGLFFSSYGQGADIRFQTGNGWDDRPNSSLLLSNNGNVGIGTLNPDMKLTVNGNIHAKEVKIDLNIPVPDYVFKDNYELRSLEELEKFIIENSHLPEIPSAEEFKQNGVMQAEMDMNLLKKIEELTLYTIEQEKKINEQSSKLKKQEREITELKSLNKKLFGLQKRLEKLENK